MVNPVADLKLAVTVMSEVHQALPVFAKGLLDLKQAWIDKGNPTAFATDFDKFITDNQPLLDQLLTLAGAAGAAAA